MRHNDSVTPDWGSGTPIAVHPHDSAVLDLYARGEISSREFARRVLTRMGAMIPESLQGERRRIAAKPVSLKSFATPAPSKVDEPPSPQTFSAQTSSPPKPADDYLAPPSAAQPVPTKTDDESSLRGTSSMSEDTAAILRGELDIDGWLKRAEEKYRTL